MNQVVHRVACRVVAAGMLWMGMGRLPAQTGPASSPGSVRPGIAPTNQPFCGPALPPGWNGPTNEAALRLASPGTRRMIERVQKLAAEIDPAVVPFFNGRRVALYEGKLAQATEPTEKAQLRAELGVELLRAGRSLEALQQFDAIESSARDSGSALATESLLYLRMQRAIAWLRLGEQENCQLNHTSASCLLPIAPPGYHQLPRGSSNALAELRAVLAVFPEDLRARWLLNVAHMTLGEYPSKVPPQWLIPPAAFMSDYDIKKFPDVAGNLGLDVDDLAGASIAEDFDGDGFVDLMVSAWGMDGQLRLFRNNGDGTFTERTASAGLWGLASGLHGMPTDYNNDGHLDVLLLRGAWMGRGGVLPNSLLRNNGDGTFDDVTEEAGMLSFHPTQAAVWFDFDGDGWLDVFIGNESTAGNEHPCELYRNNRNGTFTECAAALGVAVKSFIKGVTSGDYNNDGRPDLYLSARGARNLLFRNDGPVRDAGGATNGWRFTEIGAEAGVQAPLYSFPTWTWDYDNDGWEDIFVSGYFIESVGDVAADLLKRKHRAERPRLYRNNGNGTFSNVTAAARLDRVLMTMGCSFGDLDNDGWLDFYLATGDPDLATLMPNLMFRNAEGRFFQDVTTSSGTGHLQKGHGVSMADFDNDGDLDVHVVMGGAYTGDNFRNALFLNPGHGNHWLKLKLEGVRSNRPGIGARIRVEVDTPQGPRSIYRTVNSGASFGVNPLRQEIGLGQATAIRQVEIRWPATGQIQVLRGLAMDAAYQIREGADTATPLPHKAAPFDLARKQSHRPHDPR